MSRHNGNPNDEVFVDKYAQKAVSLDSTPTQFKTKSQAVVDTAGLEGFASKTQKEQEDKAQEKKPEGRFSRKMKRLFGTVGQMQTMFLQGFKMGAVVGGIFGGMTGLYYAFQTRSFMYIPMIMLTSGGSFGFFMGIGNIMRSEMEEKTANGSEENDDEYSVVTVSVNEDASVSVSREPIYYRQCMQQV
ncbi:hypothetical protein FGO68_gene11471 [Halteria grandinella]|uniref:Transmembrane protein n=1 Tax=Halteria grandinella TaxID=5974 RepID=A0A8J8T3G1_HALGN|nr:hypothetical protein FGO68_gene11471 [Halteria grandinella]